MVESDLEGPWVKADHAFDSVAKAVPNGDRVFQVISSYDDVRFLVEKVPGYEAGDTLKLIAPLLVAHGADDRFLREVAASPENTRMVPGARETIGYLRGRERFYLISTSYQQYVEFISSFLGVPKRDTFCTAFPVDRLSAGIRERDIRMVKDWTRRIAAMPPIEVGGSGKLLDGCREPKQALDEFFWKILPESSFGRLMEAVKPVGGNRKYDALLKALSREERSLAESRVIGDSITDSVMLSKARDAGGLAVSFNGNRYSIRNSNVAILSTSCWATAAVLEAHAKGGIEAVKEAADAWDPSIFGRLRSQGLVRPDLAKQLQVAFPSGDSFPRVYWLDHGNVDAVIAESEAFRKKVRGTNIGALG